MEGWSVVLNGIDRVTTWELGVPSGVGPLAANSGVNVYGTDLDARYVEDILNASAKGIGLRSPLIDLAGDTLVTLQFAFFLELAADELGGGRVNILDEQGEILGSLNPLLIKDEVPEGAWTTFGPVRLPQLATDAGKIIVEFEFLSSESAEESGAGLYIDVVVVK